jgi:hypothetical protein
VGKRRELHAPSDNRYGKTDEQKKSADGSEEHALDQTRKAESKDSGYHQDEADRFVLPPL